MSVPSGLTKEVDDDHLSGPQLTDRVKAIILFGSRARGDSDVFSDVDVVAFANVRRATELHDIHQRLQHNRRLEKTEITLYSTFTAEDMATKGSLFLWHLRLEGKVLLARDEWLAGLMAKLAPYPRQRALLDLATLQRILDDIDNGLRVTSLTTPFEAASLYTVLRNTGIIASFVSGSPLFSRRLPVEWLASQMGDAFPYSGADLDFLEECRLAYNGKRSFHTMPTQAGIALLVSQAQSVLSFAVRRVRSGS